MNADRGISRAQLRFGKLCWTSPEAWVVLHEDGLLVVLSISLTALALYVVMALNEGERLLANELEPLTRRASSGTGL